ncbi:MAG: acyl-CoA dehydrogenase family protein [Actinobacteria bacterium]|nr:acyl-CoA dehydrogenase family protein [Actinomycetota bacterium]
MSHATAEETGAWELPDELKLLRQTVADFIAREVAPAEHGEDPDAYKLPPEKLAPLRAKAQAAGLWCLATPEEYGGGGLGMLAQALVAEEAAKCRMGAYVPACGAFGFDPPSVVFESGTPEQIERYAVPAVETGEKTFVAISEAAGGSDPARSIETVARRDGDRYLLTGSKFWITGGMEGRWGIVFARTAPGKDRGGISCFLVQRDFPGFQAIEIPVIRPWSPAELVFEEMPVPAANLLGEEGRGFEVCKSWLTHERIPYAAGTVGIATAALAMAVDYAKERRAFGSTLAQKQAIQWMLADSEIELRAARLLVWEAAWKADLGRPFGIEASVAKVYATETAYRVVDRCVQVLGGMGVAKEHPFERWFREMRIKRIGEGPSEVHRMVVARHLLGDAMRTKA